MLQFNKLNKTMGAPYHFRKRDFFQKRKLLLLLLVLIITTTITCCSKKYIIEAACYHGISSWHSNNTVVDLQKVEEHINSFNLPSSPVYYTGRGKSEADATADAEAQAQKDINQWLAKFKKEDFEALDLHPNTSFRWEANVGDNYLGEFKWNMPN
jgi:preprotein translocase subunit SecF